ncbi:hypothetical protein RUM43_011438 [Polyplax serrata]|uniref:Serine/threonine/tyrosine-interacting protein n=1 Tax=Polyplax serrata TaxID=468196 RepID=A0AAN8P903_POLSC
MEFSASLEFPKIPQIQEANEWAYIMRRTMQEIVPGLYLGPYSAATKSKLDVLLHSGITHVVCVRQDVESRIIKPHFADRFKYLVLNIADTNTENIIKHFPNVCVFIEEAISNGGKCLVHSNAGISRSAALVMAYIMQKYGLSSREAFTLVQQRRFCINPNEGFMAQLREFEPIYRAQQSRINGQCSTENNRNKRRLDDLDDSSCQKSIGHFSVNGKIPLQQFISRTQKSCCYSGKLCNSIHLKNCNSMVGRVLQNSQASSPLEAMDQEITS